MSERFTYPMGEIRKAKDRAQEAAARCDRFSVPVNGTLSAAPVLESFECLRMNPNFMLIAFLRGNVEGDSRVVALPAGFELGGADDLRFPLADLCDVDKPYARYSSDYGICVPLGAGLRFMRVVDGDGSPWSYLCASLAVRQLLDVAVFGPDVREHDWFEHRIVAAWPRCLPRSLISGGYASKTPRRPEVVGDSGVFTVRFYSYHRPTGTRESVQLHEDTYREGTYDPFFTRTDVAVGRGPAWWY